MQLKLGTFRPFWTALLMATTSVALIATSGCFKKKVGENRANLRLAISDEPPRLDPRKATDHTSGAILRMCHEPLMRMNEKGAPECGLAEKYTVSEDGLTYTFYIRPNAKWSNGDALTAYDFEYAWKKILDPKFFDADYAYQFYCIKNAFNAKEKNLPIDEVGIRVKSDRIFVVELERPTPYFLDLVSFYSFCPVHHMISSKNQRWAEDAGEDYVCSGPFRLVNWKHQTSLNLEKNEHYWNADCVRLQNIDISVIKDANTCLNLYESGEIDLIGTSPFGELPTEAMETFERDKTLKRIGVTTGFWCILNIDHPLLQNKHIRKALALAINRQAIAKNVVPGMFIATTHMLPASLRRNQTPLFEDGNISLAREHFAKGLEETGGKREDFNKLILITDIKSSHLKVMQAIQQQWRDAFGIEVKLQQFERNVYLHNLKVKAFNLARGQWNADFFDAGNFVECFKYKNYGNNHTGWEHPQYIEYLEQASSETNREKRQYLMEQAEALIIDEMPIIPVFEQIGNLLTNPKLKCVRQTVLGPLDLREAYFEN